MRLQAVQHSYLIYSWLQLGIQPFPGFDHWENVSTAVIVVAVVIPCSLVILGVTCTAVIIICIACMRKKGRSGYQMLALINEG